MLQLSAREHGSVWTGPDQAMRKDGYVGSVVCFGMGLEFMAQVAFY